MTRWQRRSCQLQPLLISQEVIANNGVNSHLWCQKCQLNPTGILARLPCPDLLTQTCHHPPARAGEDSPECSNNDNSRAFIKRYSSQSKITNQGWSHVQKVNIHRWNRLNGRRPSHIWALLLLQTFTRNDLDAFELIIVNGNKLFPS